MNLKNIFDDYCIKIVSKNDKRKLAYVLNKGQKRILENTGLVFTNSIHPPTTKIYILNEKAAKLTTASYYISIREGSNRPPEARMGQEFINNWLQIGDVVALGSINGKLCAIKDACSQSELESKSTYLDESYEALNIHEDILFHLARKVRGVPPKIPVKPGTLEFVRNKLLVRAAIIRANEKCEMPSCPSILFNKDDGEKYLEAHHIEMLSDGGVDELDNVAALCPTCHREMHFGEHRAQKKSTLKSSILRANKIQ